MINIKNSTKNLKILRWRLDLENFDYEVQYREGKTNVVADALSRKTEITTDAITNTNSSISDTATPNESNLDQSHLRTGTPTMEKQLTLNINNNENSPISETSSDSDESAPNPDNQHPRQD